MNDMHLLALFGLASCLAPQPPSNEPAQEDPWRETVSARIADASLAFRMEGAAWSARAGGLQAQLDVDGARLGDPDGAIGLRTDALGRDGGMDPIRMDAPRPGACIPGREDPAGACIQRMELRAAGLTEWWAALPDGFEQGWTVEAPPHGEGALVVSLAVEGAAPVVGDDEVWLEGEDGVVWVVSAFSAWDADGRVLPVALRREPAGFSVQVDDEGARYPIEIDPIYSTATTTLTEGSAAYFGTSVARAGDVNNDGYDDVIVGAYAYSNNTGQAFVYLGSANGLSSTASTTLTGPSSQSYFGFSVAGAGDVNNDGYDDVIVGAYAYGANAGRAYVYHGSSSGIPSTATQTITSSSNNSYLGISVAGAGDVNNDGYDDVIIGASRNSTNTGQAFVHHGSSSGISATAATTLTGGSSNSYFGFSVAGAGDTNGDGYDDVIVGAYGHSSSTGRAVVYRGSSSGITTSSSRTLTGSATGDAFGTAVAGAGDVNGDGYADVVIGAPGYSTLTGRVYVYHGSSSGIPSSITTTLTGGTAGDAFGGSVAGAGDVNGDGRDDLMVGAPGYSSSTGRAYLYESSSSGVSTSISVTLTGAATSSQFGVSVRGAGDVDGDGYDDVIVGSNGYNSGTGRAQVFHGYIDADGDGYAAVDDCDDADSGDYPGATETIGNGDDEDCDGGELCYDDDDNDGYLDTAGDTRVSTDTDCTDAYEGTNTDPTTDCDDTDAGDYPGATEIVGNSDDEDCNGGEICYDDDDNDGYLDTAGDTRVSSDADCNDAYEGTNADPTTDCDDTDSGDHPGATETVGNEDDEDCDGGEICYDDDDGDGTLDTTGDTRVSADTDCADANEARAGTPTTDCNDNDAAINTSAVEVCDAANTDEDCDGLADDASAQGQLDWYTDADQDGYGDPSSQLHACDGPTGSVNIGDDCDDTNALINPSAVEVCDAADTDEDCNGLAEESGAVGEVTWYFDTDGDGYGDPSTATQSCDYPSGAVLVGGDCDDLDGTINPGAQELCDAADTDEDCDGQAEESGAVGEQTWYEDADGDGFGDPSTASLACDPPSGGVSDASDCDDTDADDYPGAPETIANGDDEDCDGTEICYVDADSDGYRDGVVEIISANPDCSEPGEALAGTPDGDCDDNDAGYNPGAAETDCADPNDYNCDGSTGYADNDADGYPACQECDDGDPNINPSATETLADAIDYDCDGRELCLLDADDDGYLDGNGATVLSDDVDCLDPNEADGSAPLGDCDETRADVNPGSIEICDESNTDEDCNGFSDDEDEGTDPETMSAWYPDADGDGFGADPSLAACDDPSADTLAYSGNPGDCDDAAPGTYPGAEEIAGDGIDQDCDGADQPVEPTDDTGTDDTAADDSAADDSAADDSAADDSGPNDTGDFKADNECGCASGAPSASRFAPWLALLLFRRRRR